jgi:hypothetical protein
MKDLAHQIDGVLVRTSARLADKVRAALEQSFDPKEIANAWLRDFPLGSSATSQQARDWVRLHYAGNTEALGDALGDLYAAGYVLGQDYANAAYAIALERKRLRKDAAGNIGVDTNWADWVPGNQAAQALLDKPGGLKQLLIGDRVQIKGIINDTTKDRIGTVLANALGSGATDLTAAADILGLGIKSILEDPSRALTIATTEMNRATSQATIDTYNELGLEMIEWFALEGCEDCEANAEAGPQPIDNPDFPSGDTEPPAHTNCRCSILPYIGDDSTALREGAGGTGEGEAQIEEEPAAVIPEMEPLLDTSHDIDNIVPNSSTIAPDFVPGQWQALDTTQREQMMFDELWPHNQQWSESTFRMMLQNDNMTAQFIAKGGLYKNGDHYIRTKTDNLSKAKMANLKKRIEDLQAFAPKPGMTVSVGWDTGADTFGHAIRGDSAINLAKGNIFDKPPSDASRLRSAGRYKMPALADVSQLEYTLAHEWGHSIDVAGVDYALQKARILDFYAKNKDLGFVSEYGLSKPVELYAEMFAEWYLTKGQTTNAFVQAFAREFGWI